MKKSYSILSFLLVLSGFAAAQTTLSAPQTLFELTVSPNKVVESKVLVTNTATTQKTYTWIRTTVCQTQTWENYICDPQLCYLATTDTCQNDIVMAAGESGQFYIHIDPKGTDGSAHVEVKIFEVGNPTNSLTLIWKANGAACASSTDEPTAARAKLFPNPASSYFRLENVAGVESVKITTLDGRRVAFFEATPDHNYSIAELPAATYVLTLHDRTGRTVRVLQLKKV